MKYLKNNKKGGFLIHFDFNTKIENLDISKTGYLIFQIWTYTFLDMRYEFCRWY